MKKVILLCICSVLSLYGRVIDGYDNSIGPGQHITLNETDTLILKEKMFIEAGASLTLEPGVLVKGEPGSALIVCKNAKLIAEGTKDKPIIFTATQDSLKEEYNIQWYPKGDIHDGYWGGIVFCGNAPVDVPGGNSNLTVIGDARADYGGSDESDTSGVLSYVSIRYAGTNYDNEFFHDAMDDKREFGGLTLCGVGNGTRIENVEVYCSMDDGFKFLGGTVNCKYLLAAYCADNGFDYDEGYKGTGQFYCGYLRRIISDNEGIGCVRHENGNSQNRPIPMFANMTLVTNDSHKDAIVFSKMGGARYVNSIFFDAGKVNIMEMGTTWSLTKSNDISIMNCVFGKGGYFDNTDWGDFAANDSTLEMLAINNNDIWYYDVPSDNFFKAFSNVYFGVLAKTGNTDLRPIDTLPLMNIYRIDDLDNSYLTPVCYKGAFDPSEDTVWIRKWTALDFHQFLSREDIAPRNGCPTGVTTKVGEYKSGISKINFNNGILSIEHGFGNDEKTLVYLFNIQGKIVGSHQLFGKKSVIPLQSCAPGLYICQIKSKQKIKTHYFHISK